MKILTILTSILASCVSLAVAEKPLPVLNLPNSGADPNAIDYANLPILKGRHVIVNPVAPGPHADGPDRIDMHHLRLNLHKYPHVIEHDGHVLIALCRGKVQTEVFRVRLDDIDALNAKR